MVNTVRCKMCNVERELALVFSLLVNGDLAAHLLRRSAVDCPTGWLFGLPPFSALAVVNTHVDNAQFSLNKIGSNG